MVRELDHRQRPNSELTTHSHRHPHGLSAATWRATFPRFTPEALKANQAVVCLAPSQDAIMQHWCGSPLPGYSPRDRGSFPSRVRGNLRALTKISERLKSNACHLFRRTGFGEH